MKFPALAKKTAASYHSKSVSTIYDAKKNKQQDSDYRKVSSKEFWGVSKWVAGLFFKLEPLYFSTFIITSIFGRFNDIINSFIFAKIIDVLIKVSQQGTARLSDLYPYLVVLVVYGIFNRILNFVAVYSNGTLRLLTEPKIKRTLYSKLNTLGIQTLEQPGMNDRIYRTAEYVGDVYGYVDGLVGIISFVVQIIGTLIIVASFFPAFIPLVVIVVLPYYLSDRKYRGMVYKFIFDETHRNRMAEMSASDLGNPMKLSEISIVKAFGFLDTKYYDYRIWYQKVRARIGRNRRFFNESSAYLSDLATYLGFAVVFTQLLKKLITVGDVTFRVALLARFQSSFNDIIRQVNNQMEQAVRIREVYLLSISEPAFRDGDLDFPRLEKGPDLEVKNISFRYPNSEKLIFDKLSLKIKSGEKIAIVGHNGAGKTTLAKLLCRIYLPATGAILVNDQNLSELKIDSWYKNIGVLFQDYNTYPQLTARENIIIGNPGEPADEIALRLAAQSADALAFINEFPNKFDQILSEKFKGGIRPSTGQWQKLAIARFFYRNAPLVIFDEPTASIDAVSEYNIFNRIYAFFKHKTVIIISHRFSTVRNADRIVVLAQGAIVEEGTHDFLMGNNGYYAKAFNLQAKGYNNGEEQAL